MFHGETYVGVREERVAPKCQPCERTLTGNFIHQLNIGDQPSELPFHRVTRVTNWPDEQAGGGSYKLFG